MTAFALLFTLAAIGLAETSYLVRKRQSGEHAVCVIGKGCSDVLEGKYNKTLGIHNDALGLVFYAAMMIATALIVLEVGDDTLAKIASALLIGAVLMTLRFIYLQWRVIKVWCFWCLMSASTIGLMLLIVLIVSFDRRV